MFMGVHGQREWHQVTSWPSGLRRNVKAVVLVGVGSNTTDVNLFSLTVCGATFGPD